MDLTRIKASVGMENRLGQDKRRQIGKSFKSKLIFNKSLAYKALDYHLKILSSRILF